MAKIKHTYLFEPTLWTINGIYYDENEQVFEQEGHLSINHSPDIWTIDGQIEIKGLNPSTLNNYYEVTPMTHNLPYTQWKSNSGGPEAIYGLFVIVNDTIMSPWQSESGVYWGQEVLRQLSEDEYQSRGFTFLKDKKVSSWATRLLMQR